MRTYVTSLILLTATYNTILRSIFIAAELAMCFVDVENILRMFSDSYVVYIRITVELLCVFV